jgi:DNA-binding protein WhiA
MSFASEVKKEISNIQGDDCCLKAELYSIIKYRSTIKVSTGSFKIEIITTLNAIARRIIYLFKKIYSVKLEIILVEKKKLDYKNLYVLTTTEKGLDILKDLDLIDENYQIK